MVEAKRASCLAAIAVLAWFASATANADELDERFKMWDSRAAWCEYKSSDRPRHPRFPTRLYGSDSAQPCNDGDMTLFNGLLCFAGDQRGCQGVRDAQDPETGQWFRSPRMRQLPGNPKNDQGGASLSPDMNVGINLYLLATRDIERGMKWFQWLHRSVPQGSPFPRVCTEVDGCTMKPGDLAMTAAVVNFLQKNAGMQDLPPGRLRGALGSASGRGPQIVLLDAEHNKPGYSRHLAAAGVSLLRAAIGSNELLDAAARTLEKREPRNPYFAFLIHGRSPEVVKLTLDACPATASAASGLNGEWLWELEQGKQSADKSSHWDCIFMYRMLRPRP